MSILRKYLPVVFIFLIATPSSFAGEQMFTYYNQWCMGTDGQWSLSQPWFISSKTYATQLGNTSHVIYFMGREIVKSDFPPYFSVTKEYADNSGSSTDSIDFLWNGANNPGGGYASWVSRGGLEALRDSLHAKGKKLILCIQAVNASTGLNYVFADSARTEVFTKAIAGYVTRHNFDGADLNVENSQTYTNADLIRFFRMLRRNMPSPKLITTVPPVTSWGEYTGAISYIDYVLPQCYAYASNWANNGCGGGGSNVVGLKAPLNMHTGVPGVPAGNQQDLTTWGPNQWYNSGWPKSKIVILLSNEALPYTTGDTLFSCAPWAPFWSDTMAQTALTKGGTKYWNSTYVGSYIAGTATASIGGTISAGQKFIIEILSDRNIDSVVAWGRRNGYSNFGLYDVSTDTRTPDAIKNPRHYRMSSILNAGPPPQLPSGSLNVTPDSLGIGGGNATLTWTSSNALSASINQGVGTVALSGSRSVTVTSTTTFTLTLTNADGSQAYTATVRVYVPLPSGTFSVTPDTLPAGGGTVLLSWTSFGADTAVITPQVGRVPLSGSQNASVGTTTAFVLSLNNAGGERRYTATVVVGLPAGHGLNDITSQGTPLALITAPTGQGNHNIEIVRDGNTPAVGSSNVLDQYDTYTGGGQRAVDWIGYEYSTSRTFSQVFYQEGLDNQWGGCFETLRVQYRNNGTWQDVRNLTSSPIYPGSNLINFESFTLSFEPSVGNAIRLLGTPTGTARYFGIAEMRVFEEGSSYTPGDPETPRDFALHQNYPNPFNPATVITYTLPYSAAVELRIFDILGREITSLVNGVQPAGRYSVRFDAQNLTSGVYVCSIRAGDFVDTKKMILMK